MCAHSVHKTKSAGRTIVASAEIVPFLRRRFTLGAPLGTGPASHARPVLGPSLKPGGFLCCLIPTFNQVEKTLIALRQTNFAFVEVCELLLRFFQAEPSRLRPTDRMVAHTGFLVFARRIEPTSDPRGKELVNEVSIE
jgi:hypothetical protein